MKQTPWGEIEVADAHVHFFSPPFFQSLGPNAASNLAWDPPESSEYLADRWIVELNHKGVERAVVIGSIPGDVESVGAAVNRHPDRLRSIVMINPLLPGADLRCTTALAEGQIHGIFLFPAMHQYSMHD